VNVFTVVYDLLLLGGDVLTTFCMGSFIVFHVNQGVSLTQAREKGQLVFLEGLKESLGVLLQGEASKGTRTMDFLRYHLSVVLTSIKPTPGLKSMFIQCRSSIKSAFWSYNIIDFIWFWESNMYCLTHSYTFFSDVIEAVNESMNLKISSCFIYLPLCPLSFFVSHPSPPQSFSLSLCSLPPLHRDPSSGLRGLYDFVRDNVRGAVGGAEEWGPPVLLVDDLSVVLSLGVSVGAALDFSHYCRATVCSELQVR
jgi:hypothetical protein